GGASRSPQVHRRLLRLMSRLMRERLIGATAALVLGVAFSYAMYRWQPPYTNPSPGQTKIWIVTAIPFAGLAVLIGCGLRRSAGVLGWVVLAALTGLAYGGSSLWWRLRVTGTTPLDYEVFYGAIVLGNLLRFRGRPSRRTESTTGAPNATAARRLGIALLV